MKTRRLLFSLALALGLTLAVLAGLGGKPPRARADTYTVTNTDASGHGSLRQAILDANVNAGHDTINFGVTGAIVLTDALPAIGDDLTITGPGAEQLDISGANAYRVFYINSGAAVTITGVTVRDGSADYGGGIWSAGDLYLGAAHIISNAVSISGGGVYVSDGSATLNGTQVVSNLASSNGGGVYVDQGSATLSGTQVVSNSAGYSGGGVYIYQGSATLDVSGGEVGSNSASHDGGGVYVRHGSATLSGTQVVSNSANFGGGVYVYEGSAILSGTQVLSNSAFSGGGVYVDQGSATLSVSEVGSNSASDGDGGGVFVYQGSATLNETQVVNNSASNTGGGVFVLYGSAMLNETQVIGNSAADSGGGVLVNQGSATLSGTQVVSNSAFSGGGVYVRDGSVTLSRTQVVSNSANYGGGVYVNQDSATLNVSGGEISSNSVITSGGGVYVNQGSATLNGTQVVSNSAFHFGGGVYVDQISATLNVSGGGIDSNWASNSGGGVYVHDGSVTLSGTQMINNSANYGGGMYVNQGGATMTGTQVLSNSAQFECGGVCVSQASATLSMSGGKVGNNSAGSGGGVYVLYGGVTLSGTQVVSNSAFHFGGGVYVDQISATLNVSGGGIDGNWASNSGGGVYVHDGSVTLSGTQMINNSANYGGGMYVNQGGATMTGTQVVSNSAFHFGGGVYVDQISATLNVSGGGIDGNWASNSGGGVYVHDGSVTLSGTQVVGNSASSGGGVFVHSGSATLSGTQVVSNSAVSGGGVYASQSSATLNVSGGGIDGNSANNGGGVYVNQGSAMLSGTQVVSNSASYYGGGVYVREGSATLSGTQVVSNSASYSGGGMYVYQGSAALSGTQVLNNSASSGGGLYLFSSIGAITATDGCIVYNSDTAVDNNSSATLNARDNWWGMPDGPSGVGPGSGDSVSAYVDYANFEISPPDGCPMYTPDLSIAKSVTPTTDAAYHGAVTYTVGLNNSGWLSDTNVLFTDTLPSGVDFGAFVGADHGASVDNDEITWTGAVTAGEALTWTFTALHTGGYGDVVTNTAKFSGTLQAGEDDAVFAVVGPPEITVAPLSLAFDDQDVDAGATVSQTVIITNDGGADLHISSIILTGTNAAEFKIESDSGENPLTPGSTRAVQVSFDPTITGTKSASLTIQSDDADESTVDVTLSGVGTTAGQPGYGSSPAPGSSINVGTASVGSTVSATLTISETGDMMLMVTPTLSGADAVDFVVTPLTLTILDGEADQDLTIECAPSVTGTLAATLTVAHNATGSPAVYPLICTGEVTTVPEITVEPASLTFGDQDVDAGLTVSQTVTITNDGGVDLHISSVILTGTNAAEFEIESDSSENPLTPGSTRAVQVSFDPGSVGTKSANLSIASNDSDEPTVDVILSGAGTSAADIYTLTVSVDGAGSGVVSSAPAGINCGAACQVGFTDGTVVTLTAVASGGSTFAGWTGEGCTGAGDYCTVTMTETRQVTAGFNLAAGQPGYGSTPAPGSPINVGTAGVGSTVSATLTISEMGDMMLMVTPTLSGADAVDFVVTPTTLTILDGGAAQDLTIGCTPSVTGTLAATLTVAHNAPGSPAVYPLSCIGGTFRYIYLPLVLRNN